MVVSLILQITRTQALTFVSVNRKETTLVILRENLYKESVI